MKIYFAVDQLYSKPNTAQVKIMRKLIEYISQRHQIVDTLLEGPDIIISNGYKMSLLMRVLNWFIGAKQIVILSETPEILSWWWKLLFTLKWDKVFVTSGYIRDKLGYGEVVRLGYV